MFFLTPSPGTLADAHSVFTSQAPAKGRLAGADIGLTRIKTLCCVYTRDGGRERVLGNELLFWPRVFIRELLTEGLLKVTDVRQLGIRGLLSASLFLWGIGSSL